MTETTHATPDHAPWSSRLYAHREGTTLRTSYEVDKDRIVNCETFRELQYKTQVQSLDTLSSRGFRTRLNHVIEVAQIARRLSRGVGADDFLSEAISLGHDLGHPPFGHAGERALHSLLAKAGHPAWNANVHSLAVVDLIERSHIRHRGLNLTWATREGIARHSTPFDEPVSFGEFARTSNGGLECQIVDAADYIAYLAHDLDDALSAGYVTTHSVSGLNGTLARLLAESEADWKATGETRWPLPEREPLIRKALVGRLVELVIPETIGETKRRIASLDPANHEAVRQSTNRTVGAPPEVEGLMRELLSFLMTNYYRSADVSRMDQNAEQIVYELFDFLLANIGEIPERFRTDDDALAVGHYLVSLNDQSATQLAVEAGVLEETGFQPGWRRF